MMVSRYSGKGSELLYFQHFSSLPTKTD